MGNTCAEPQPANHYGIAQPIDQEFKGEVDKHQVDAPETWYASKSDAEPNTISSITKALNNQIRDNPLKAEQLKGFELGLYYINDKDAYYQGEWRCGIPNGKGKVYFKNGAYFQGYFSEGEANCQDGIYIYPDGSSYRGQIRQSIFEGKGVFKYRGGMIYEGSWKNGKPDGQGQQVFSDRNIYQGQYSNGLKNGKGIFKWADGKVYQGQFVNGYMQGKGTLKKGDSAFFQGFFFENMMQGIGKMTTPFGVFQGPFKDGQMEGLGFFKWNDGKYYQGGFQRGKLHGKATITYPNGEKIEGVWQKGYNKQMHEIFRDCQ